MASSTSSHSSSNSVPGNVLEGGAPVGAGAHLDHVTPQGLDRAATVVDELVGGDGEEAVAALLVGGRGAQDERPLRPRVVDGPVARGLGHDLELVHLGRALAVRRAQAVGARCRPRR